MTQYISKSGVVAELEKRIKEIDEIGTYLSPKGILTNLLCYINGLEVIDPYAECIQYDSIKAGIQANAETYSFNIESELFNQLTTEEQQALWRKEIEQAYVSGGEVGVELARDPRYKENIKVKEVNLDKEIQQHINNCLDIKFPTTDTKMIAKDVEYTARKFFELGLKSQKGG